MRYVGLVLGGLYLIDGLIAMLGGRKAVKLADETVGGKLPGTWKRTMREMANVDQRVIKAWGINQLIAGTGMLIVALLVGMRGARPGMQQ